jgi:nitrite reductase/ring-hydroxylating ferredoxin subunit
MEGYRRVGGVDEFREGRIRVFIVGGKRVAVVLWRDRLYAFADECTHQGVTLRTAELTGANELVCPVHYAAYELGTGRVIDGPSLIEDLPVFDVRIQDGGVFLPESQPGLTNARDQTNG